MSGCTCVCVCVYTCGNQRSTLGVVIPQAQSSWFLDMEPLAGMETTDRLSWLARQSQCQPVSTSRVIDRYPRYLAMNVSLHGDYKHRPPLLSLSCLGSGDWTHTSKASSLPLYRLQFPQPCFLFRSCCCLLGSSIWAPRWCCWLGWLHGSSCVLCVWLVVLSVSFLSCQLLPSWSSG